MKFLQVDSFYGSYIDGIYASHSDLARQPFSRQVKVLLDGGFSIAHNFAIMMDRLGYESTFIVGNALRAQSAWLEENRSRIASLPRTLPEVFLSQIDLIQPDILHVGDTDTFDARLLKKTRWKPRLTLGWRAAPIAASADFSVFDVVLSSHSGCRERGLALGAAAAEPFSPGLPRSYSQFAIDEPKVYDVVFAGQIGPLHRKRIEYLERLVAMPEVRTGAIRLGLFLAGTIPETLRPHALPPVFGNDFYRVLRQGRIALNVHIDMTGDEIQNMRMFEVLTMGTFLLTDYGPNLDALFRLRHEIESFCSPAEMVDKIRYYLANPSVREGIARCGQERCLNEHSMEERIVWLDQIIRCHLDRKEVKTVGSVEVSPIGCSGVGEAPAPVIGLQCNDFGLLMQQAEFLFGQAKFSDSITWFAAAASLAPDFPDVHFKWGKALSAMNCYREALSRYRMALSLGGENPELKSEIARMLSGMNAAVHA
ncbi:glycosyltransferase family protein [Thiorhodococcus fuscus]|uniref:Glycosyltransferase n=1 Tax=Thiorhodococcus fuscus TaxID=527200 RepID=A0ABW4YAP9_9GAMM